MLTRRYDRNEKELGLISQYNWKSDYAGGRMHSDGLDIVPKVAAFSRESECNLIVMRRDNMFCQVAIREHKIPSEQQSWDPL